MLTAQVCRPALRAGFRFDVGVRGFVPATHVGNGKIRNIEKYVGQPLQLKVIEIDRERRKVVLSNRQAEDERRASAKEEVFGKVTPRRNSGGKPFEGLPITELSWTWAVWTDCSTFLK